jgi:formylglycine-generating enzyme required for sulfatase activity
MITPSTTAATLSSEITDAKGVVMRLVPAGEFTMGSESDYSDAKPEHQVYLDTYYMDSYEVTNGLYADCVSVGGCYSPKERSQTRSLYYGAEQYKDYPVVNITWNQASGYCQWRGARLPTEAEWEKAARGNDKRTYPWGEVLDDTFANYKTGDTTKVGSYEKGISPYGVYDLMGNVWEWVADWYSETYYAESVFSNPLGPASGLFRVIRGGSWNSHDSLGRTWVRSKRDPSYSFAYVGFRCVMTP